MGNKEVSRKPGIGILRELFEEICDKRNSYRKIGKVYGVSDNAVRKRFKTEGWELPKLKKWRCEYECDYCGSRFEDDISRRNDSRHWVQYCNKECMDNGRRKKV